MPPDALSRHLGVIRALYDSMPIGNRLGVVSFGRTAVLECPPQQGEFSGFVHEMPADQSSLSEGLETALAVLPTDANGRVLVVSDGQWTGRDPLPVAARAAGRALGIDYRLLRRPGVNDVSIERVSAPQSVTPGQSFMISAWVRMPAGGAVSYRLARGGTVVSAGTRELGSGSSRLLFRDRATAPGTVGYRLEIQGAIEDPVPENNTVRLLMGVEGVLPILCVSQSTDSSLAELLRAGGLAVECRVPGECRWTLEALSRYRGVIIEDVRANDIGSAGLEVLAAWVQNTGNGLVVTGGRQSYGPGGYFRSPVEPILPVSMELRREHRKLSLAIVVALDRSGSMAMAAGGGRTKMDLANIGAVQVLDLLSDMDEFGVVAVDSAAHVVVERMLAAEAQGLRHKVLEIDSMGGGIFVYEALVEAARMLMDAEALTRHIILFADAADSEHPARYKELLETCRRANITVSVVGLGTENDVDAGLLKDVAERGEGRCFFTKSPEEIPVLFAQDTFAVARSTFVGEATPVAFTGGLVTLLGEELPDAPAIGGYNLCYIRPGATMAAVTVDEYEAPIVAAWQAGAGRVVCYCGEADGEYTGAMAAWPACGHFFTGLARWAIGEAELLPDSVLVTQHVDDGRCRIELHLDPEREGDPFAGEVDVRVLRGVPGAPPAAETMRMHWVSADQLACGFSLSGSETALATVEMPDGKRRSLPPVCLPYSPEFRPPRPDRGRRALERVAGATGGEERADLAGVWASLPPRPRSIDVASWLFLAAVSVFLLEVLQRRAGVPFGRRRRGAVGVLAEDGARAPTVSVLQRARRRAVRRRGREARRARGETEQTEEVGRKTEEGERKTEQREAREGDSVVSAMREVRRRGRERGKR